MVPDTTLFINVVPLYVHFHFLNLPFSCLCSNIDIIPNVSYEFFFIILYFLQFLEIVLFQIF